MKNNAYQIFKKSLSLLSDKDKIKLLLISIISLISSLLDFVSVISIYPFINIILENESIYSNKYYFFVWEKLGSPPINSYILYLSFVVISIIIISALFNFYTQYLCNMFASNIQISLGKNIYKYILYTNYEWHVSKNPIKLMTLFTSNLTKLSRNIIRQIPLLVGYISTLIIPIFSLIILSPKYALLLIFVFSFILFYFLRIIRKKTSNLSRKTRIKLDELNILLVESIQGIKDVKLSSRENDFIAKFQNIYGKYCSNISITDNFNQIPVNLILMLSQLIMVGLGTILFLVKISPSNLVGIMSIVALIAFKIIPALNKLGNALNRISESFIFSEVINDLHSELKLQLIKNRKITERKESNFIWKKINLKNVYFKYPGMEDYAIKNINIEIKKGLHYGFVGFSGSGKSTTIDILNGLLTPTKGQVYINKTFLSDFGIREWQHKIGYVPQQPKISDQSIKENIAFGLDESQIDISKIINCIEIVGLSELINTLPKGISSLIGDRGKLLSGGQQQLIAIARALYKDPEILILDEATSSLDSISEKLIRDALKRLKGKITVLTIAHHFSNIKESDHIFLFRQGKLVSQGDFLYLEKNSELFKKFIKNT